MSNEDLANIATTLTADGKGILAADGTVGTFLHDETIRQKSSGGTPLVQVLSSQGIAPGIKVDTGAKPLAAAPGATITEGLDGLPWKISFSYGRALQHPALEAWHGRDENLRSAQQALAHRARCNGAASRGMHTEEMEAESAGVGTPARRREGHDD